MTRKELEKRITDLIDNPVEYDYRKHAIEELAEVEDNGFRVRNIAYIVSQYPDFNHVELKVTIPNHFILSLRINPYDYKDLPPRKKKRAIRKLVKMYSGFAKGGHEE